MIAIPRHQTPTMPYLSTHREDNYVFSQEDTTLEGLAETALLLEVELALAWPERDWAAWARFLQGGRN